MLLYDGGCSPGQAQPGRYNFPTHRHIFLSTLYSSRWRFSDLQWVLPALSSSLFKSLSMQLRAHRARRLQGRKTQFGLDIRPGYNGNTIAHNGIIMTITIAYIQSIIVQLLSHGTPCKRHAISTMIPPLARDFQTHRRRTRASLWNKQCNSVFCLRYRHDTMKGAGVDNRRQTYDGERQQLHGHGNEQARAQSARRKRQEPARGHRTRSSRSEQVVPAMQRETQRRRNNCRPQEDSP
ncbi:hypothetical protein OH76DRAFT_187079 [Lentinus brumalis]|uniref:Uncharacterized protein n=1 Tax=Lentinus brumalis TaxID=2498619 RepID=A0A371CN12_9APHY|nr:hypothetical protein OH76DRAFT_187079 [Polyporus brumalis]